jgi:hypothetical protein
MMKERMEKERMEKERIEEERKAEERRTEERRTEERRIGNYKAAAPAPGNSTPRKAADAVPTPIFYKKSYPKQAKSTKKPTAAESEDLRIIPDSQPDQPTTHQEPIRKPSGTHQETIRSPSATTHQDQLEGQEVNEGKLTQVVGE